MTAELVLRSSKEVGVLRLIDRSLEQRQTILPSCLWVGWVCLDASIGRRGVVRVESTKSRIMDMNDDRHHCTLNMKQVHIVCNCKRESHLMIVRILIAAIPNPLEVPVVHLPKKACSRTVPKVLWQHLLLQPLNIAYRECPAVRKPCNDIFMYPTRQYFMQLAREGRLSILGVGYLGREFKCCGAREVPVGCPVDGVSNSVGIHWLRSRCLCGTRCKCKMRR